MTKLTKIVLVVFALIALALWSPWTSWRFDVFEALGLRNNENSASLTVSSLAGELEVYIDGVLAAEAKITPNNSPFTLNTLISAGEHHIRLVRTSEIENAFWEYSEILDFRAGYDVNMAWELGPSEAFSGGHVVAVDEDNESNPDNVTLNVSCNISVADVKLNGVKVAQCPLSGYSLTTDRAHQLTIDAIGYEPQTFSLLPEDVNYRETLSGKVMNVSVHLFREPLKVEEAE